MIICVAGDPGGSRAVLPIAEALARAGEKIIIPEHGAIAAETPHSMTSCVCKKDNIYEILPKCKAVVFGSSATDTFPLTLAREAKRNGALVMHILDNWSSYRERLTTDKKPALIPDIYTAIDDESRQDIIEAGIPADKVFIIGQPALSEWATRIETACNQKSPGKHLKKPLKFAFISEPFSSIFGSDTSGEGHPGFTETDVLASAIKVLETIGEAHISLTILAHPKQEIRDVQHVWEKMRGSIPARIIKLEKGENILQDIAGVFGMSSILLYQSWLINLPTLSLQPGCRLPAMKRFSKLPGIFYADDYQQFPQAITNWYIKSQTSCPGPREELLLHKNSPMKAVEILLQHLGENR